MNVCFCINNLGSFGLGATVTSILKNCSNPGELHFYFLCSSVDDSKKNAIGKYLLKDFKGRYDFIDFYPDQLFKSYRPLQGDRTTYGRLLIPQIINKARVLYLDSDLLVQTDLLRLKTIDLHGHSIAAVGGTTFQYALEHNFYLNTLKLKPETISFNAGVLFIDVEQWNKNSVSEKIAAIADAYPNELLAADQTLLNAYFNGNFCNLPSHYNILWGAGSKPDMQSNSIYHFVGSPKPWDFLGRVVHSGYAKWKAYSSIEWENNVLKHLTIEQFRRCWTIRRSYIKAFKALKT